MLAYRRIETNKKLARQIWLAEESAPRWFMSASHVWTPDYKSFLKFWSKCREIYGLFENDVLISAVYFEFLSEHSVNLHVSVVEKCDQKKLVRFFKSLKILQEQNGVKSFEGWMLDKNKGLRKLGNEAGFYETGLKMCYGNDGKRVFNWVQVRG